MPFAMYINVQVTLKLLLLYHLVLMEGMLFYIKDILFVFGVK